MTRTRRSLAWSLILALLCTSLAALQPPSAAYAADFQYVVDNALDTALSASPACTAAAKDCSLRQAIAKANADGGTSQIVFEIPPDDTDPDNGYNEAEGVWTIKPQSSLPALSGNNTEILGRNDNAVGTPRILIDGSDLSGGGVGLRITSSGNSVKQLIIISFGGATDTTGIGVRITGAAATSNQVVGNYIGNRPGGAALPNARAGVQLDNAATNNTIGTGSNPGERNVIAGNQGDGVLLRNAPGNKIYGNYIGLGLSGSATTLLPNAGNGVNLVDSANNQVGGTLGSQRNVIAGNTLDGVVLTGDATTGNAIAGNYIGLNETGATDRGNNGNGVTIADGASGNSVAGSAAAASVIAGNGGYGVLITDNGTASNQIYGNLIGVNAGGSTARPNDKGGVHVRDNASGNSIGLASQGNTIAGNTGYGVSFGRTAAGYTAIFSNSVQANLIGLNALGTTAVANTRGGVLVADGANSNQIGGSGSAAQNVIAGNSGPGVTISGTHVLSNTVLGNIIGLRRLAPNGAFTGAAGNSGDGVLIAGGALYTRVGGSAAEGNTIGANSANGLRVSGASTKFTSVRNNYIGVAFNAGAYVAAANGQHGIAIDSQAQRVTILDNHISRNTQKGIALTPNTPAPGGDPSNANHDIDPPTGLRLNQNGQLTGRVAKTGNSDACALPCTIQIFTADPAQLDGQGRDLVQEQITESGYFTVTLERLPEQLALTATDKDGNTSEFATLTTQIGPIELADAEPNVQDAIPGQVVTYTHELVNNGTVDLLDLKLSASSSRQWPIKTMPEPNTQFALAVGETKLVTVVLTLPLGPDPRVLAGPPPDFTSVTVTSTKYVTVTDTAVDTTNVLPKFLLQVAPLTRTGFGAPDSPSNVVRFVHQLVNKGNVTRTVQVQTRSVRGWVTEVSTDTIVLAPGEANARALTVSVTVPSGTVKDTIETTFIDLIVPDDPSQNTTITDTTIAELTANALLIHDGEADGEGGAGEKITFFYIVENRSNGPATFSLEGSAALGSKLTFRRTDGGVFGPGNSFTVQNTPGANTIRFAVEILLDTNLLRGTTETATILLLDDQQRIRQAAQDRIFITRGPVSRIYMPIITR